MVVYRETHLIQKEDIPRINFPKTDVIQDKQEIEFRNKIIDKALKLGNKFKNKVHIFFEDDISIKRVV